MTVLLDITNIKAGYGSKEILRDVTLNIKYGEIVGLVGHNGAGKSTLASAIIGVLKVRNGLITFKDKNVTNYSPGDRVKQGISLVPQGIGVFRDLSVIENLRVLTYLQKKTKNESESLLSEAMEFFPVLRERTSQMAGSLSGGERQMLSVAMSLLGNSDLIILDEPTLGLAPRIAEDLLYRISDINRNKGHAVFLMEENIFKALSICNRIYIIKMGRIVLEEAADELSKRKEYWDLF